MRLYLRIAGKEAIVYCTSCGNSLNESDRFCAHCGKANAPGTGEQASRTQFTGPRPQMMRSMTDKKIAGVCAGIARHFGWDVTLVRIAFLAALVVHGVGLLAYVIGWIAMPRDDQQMVEVR